ncbi:MAG: mannose-1-phosphate guanyltransferase [Methylotenera sp.]|jgi:mannose-1-phosphate guanylyltransferase|uniref:NDP-sugar synthase n=1 Tax=Methylotenera sp. TaxID=2051956 RepID=UPI000D4719CA|nr:NDP-sugar synthase [Methylotenera sp.]MDP2231242.1 NDP-sugar synthase [Methylotenera sp.]MDP3777506.1 NDP-sugar synthase [Methylotenera sp.]PPC91861.1 MAG: mannose-1-phosphate guanyltransferase [Methylotenera sp.]
MKAMILGAGKGTRVQPITHEIPKPMIPLVRKPVMEYLIELLKKHGVDQIMVNTSHLAPIIENYFRDGEQFGVSMAYSYEGYVESGVAISSPVGSAGGMKKIQDFSGFFDETFIVLCGDAWIDLDISKALEIHRQKKAIASIIIREVPNDEVFKYGIVALDKDDRILQFQEKPDPKDAISNLANTGIYIFEPEIFDYIPSGVAYDIGGELFPKLAQENLPFIGINLPFQWLDIGNVQDVWTVTSQILNGEVKGFKMPGREVRPGVHVGINLSVDFDQVNITPPVYIGGSTKIEAGATIVGPAVLGASCVVEAGAVIKNCIVEDYTRLTSQANLEGKIIFGSKCIDPIMDTQVDIAEARLEFMIEDARKLIEADEA